MRHHAKDVLIKRGHTVKVGVAHSDHSGGVGMEAVASDIPEAARYVMVVYERSRWFRPVFCVFNGFWWWRFHMSIAEQETGREIMSWSGYGCANGRLRQFNRTLELLEDADSPEARRWERVSGQI